MSTPAVIMMILALTLVWGGLAASILFMRSHPQVHLGEDPDLVLDDDGRRQAPHPTRDL